MRTYIHTYILPNQTCRCASMHLASSPRPGGINITAWYQLFVIAPEFRWNQILTHILASILLDNKIVFSITVIDMRKV